MAKKKTSRKRTLSLRDMPEVEIKNRKGIISADFSPLGDKKFIAEALWECLATNDPDAFKEILWGYLHYTNKESFAKTAGIPRRTLFRMLHPDGNPTLDNLAKIIHHLCA